MTETVSRLAQKIVVRNKLLKSFRTRRRLSAGTPRRGSMSSFAKASVWAVHRAPGKKEIAQPSVPVQEQLAHSRQLELSRERSRSRSRPGTPTDSAGLTDGATMPAFLVDKLRNHYLFAQLSEEVLRNVVDVMQRRVARKNECVSGVQDVLLSLLLLLLLLLLVGCWSARVCRVATLSCCVVRACGRLLGCCSNTRCGSLGVAANTESQR